MGLRYDAHPIGQVERTPQGGIKVPATLTRTGVFSYVQPDGSIRREYRPPAEVFRPESLAMLRGAPVTNLHPGNGRVDSTDWRHKAVGHTGDDVRQEGTHVAATVYVQDAETIRQIESGDRRQISLGYDQDYVPGKGVTPEGEPYDGVQTNIRYNHTALVPRGRAGDTVGLRLDANDDEIPQEAPVQKIVIDGKEYVVGSPEATAALAALAAKAARADALEAEIETGRRKMRLDALRVQVKPYGVDPRQDADEGGIMLETLAKIAPGVKAAGKSPEWIEGAFAAALSMALPAVAGAPAEPEPEVTDESEAAPEDEPKPGAPPPAPPGPSAASVRQDVRDARVRRTAPETRTDAAPEVAPDVAARQRMIDRLAKVSQA